MSHKWLVCIGLPGYLPDDVQAYDTFDEAVEAAVDEKERFLDDGWKVFGNIRRDWRYEAYPPDATEYTLPTYVSIEETDEWEGEDE